MPNRLAREKSPYLLQHAQNPVDWYPWGEEAFARARAEDKPIFLSIGYSTCHWCHVMERESFEHDAVAAVMNASFVNIKVDREERPDVDRVYMAFVQATTGGGGWPMSVWLTPDLKPFYGGTYYPPHDAHGRPGFTTVLEAIARTWREKRGEVITSSQKIVDTLREAHAGGGLREDLDARMISDGVRVFQHVFDTRWGGFGQAPKFPRPVTLHFLMRAWARTGDGDTLRMVTHTLRKMAEGGMNDQLAGGFHRYSVDRHWHVPHFEKMLYDQAQLVDAYLEAWQATGDETFARVARETIAYVLRDLTDAKTGGFYSAEDADSPVPGAPTGHERAEGAFYVWRWEELARALGGDLAVFAACYGCEQGGNADDPHGELTGTNVLHAGGSESECAARVGVPAPRLHEILARGRAALLAERAKRPRPHLDDKVLAGWNGLMIGALARAAAALGEPTWLDAARRAAQAVLASMWDATTGTLRRRVRDGEAAFDGQLDDYAALAGALAALYQADFDRGWLDTATAIVDAMNSRFWDAEQGGWFATPGTDPSVLLRMKEDYDGAEPSGNSLAALALCALGELCERPDWLEKVDQALSTFSGRMREAPHAAPLLLSVLDWRLTGPTHVVIAGEKDDPKTRALVDAARTGFVPRRVIILADAAMRAAVAGKAPWIAAMTPIDGAPAAYVCKARACDRPVTDAAAVRVRLASGGA